MDEDMDVYLGRRIKNWSARSGLPENGRERLFQAVVEIPVSAQPGWIDYLLTIKDFLSINTTVYHGNGWIIDPYNNSRIFSLQIATNWRLAI